MDEVHEFLASFGLVEGTTEVARGSDRVYFLYTTHLHTHVLSLDHNHHTKRMQGLFDTFLNLQGHTLLHLKAMTKDIYYTGNL